MVYVTDVMLYNMCRYVQVVKYSERHEDVSMEVVQMV